MAAQDSMFNWLRKKGGESGSAPHAVRALDRASAIARAGEALNAGDLDQAAQRYRQSLLAQPGDAELRVALSVALIGLGECAEARSHLNRAILIDPGHANACFFLAFAGLFLGIGRIGTSTSSGLRRCVPGRR